MQEIDKILKFVSLTHEFQKVLRALPVTGQDRLENDVEHSYQLAMCAWYIIDAFKLPLDSSKAVRYALLHDLVEVYAGDTDVFDENPEVHLTKHAREMAALERLKSEFYEFSEMGEMIELYESKNDEESKFIYALDKIIPPMNIYLDDGKSWHMKNISFEKFLSLKQEKFKAHPTVAEYFEQLKVLLESEQDRLFPKT